MDLVMACHTLRPKKQCSVSIGYYTQAGLLHVAVLETEGCFL